MPEPAGSVSARKELADLAARRDALRQAAALGDAGLRATLDAALAELDAAIDALAASHDATAVGHPTRRPWVPCMPNGGCCVRSSTRRRWR
jgi:hypothetical protein